MGFVNELMGANSPASGGLVPGAGDASKMAKPSFGDLIGSFAQDRFPIAGGLASQVFGSTPQPLNESTGPMLPQQQGGGGLAALLKLLG